MPVFNDTEHLYSILMPYFQELKDNPKIWPKIRASGLVIQFRYRSPEGVITIDCPGEEIIRGEEGVKPVLTMSMTAKTSHKFWLGKLNLATALLTREIVAKGQVAAALKLIPALKDAFPAYHDFLKRNGMGDKIKNWN
ncbi:MAG TPA: SCP2 sterol-binding domain-containing protein [bacterium]|nr:SCP2 sterol-binding domain-containing protein [bacterium]